MGRTPLPSPPGEMSCPRWTTRATSRSPWTCRWAIPPAPQGASIDCSSPIGTNGKLTAAGKLADGIAFSTATFVGPGRGGAGASGLCHGAIPVAGALDITPGSPATLDRRGDVVAQRLKLASSRLYEDGFGPVTLTPAGGTHAKPLATVPIMAPAHTAGATYDHLRSPTFTSGDFGTPRVAPDVPSC